MVLQKLKNKRIHQGIVNFLYSIAWIPLVICSTLLFFFIKTDFNRGIFIGILSTALIAYLIYESEKHNK